MTSPVQIWRHPFRGAGFGLTCIDDLPSCLTSQDPPCEPLTSTFRPPKLPPPSEVALPLGRWELLRGKKEADRRHCPPVLAASEETLSDDAEMAMRKVRSVETRGE